MILWSSPVGCRCFLGRTVSLPQQRGAAPRWCGWWFGNHSSSLARTVVLVGAVGSITIISIHRSRSFPSPDSIHLGTCYWYAVQADGIIMWHAHGFEWLVFSHNETNETSNSMSSSSSGIFFGFWNTIIIIIIIILQVVVIVFVIIGFSITTIFNGILVVVVVVVVSKHTNTSSEWW